MKINEFSGKYYFLSNYFPCNINYKGLSYKNTEAAFHAQKDLARSKEFVNLTPGDAKRLGRSVRLRSDWETVKIDIMTEIVRAKFAQNEELKQKLLETGDAELIEGNTWHDSFWGVYNGHGGNNLGKILMKIRKEFQDEESLGSNRPAE